MCGDLSIVVRACKGAHKSLTANQLFCAVSIETHACRDAHNSPKAIEAILTRPRSRSRSRERHIRGSGSPFSRGTDTEEGEVKEPSSPVRPGILSARQQARLADLSLLLEVILKTDYAR